MERDGSTMSQEDQKWLRDLGVDRLISANTDWGGLPPSPVVTSTPVAPQGGKGHRMSTEPVTGPSTGPKKSQTEEVIEVIEDFLHELVAVKPVSPRFTAAQIAAHSRCGAPGTISWGLQQYRKAQGGWITEETEFSIGTFERGANSTWCLFTWPDMTARREGDRQRRVGRPRDQLGRLTKRSTRC